MRGWKAHEKGEAHMIYLLTPLTLIVDIGKNRKKIETRHDRGTTQRRIVQVVNCDNLSAKS